MGKQTFFNPRASNAARDQRAATSCRRQATIRFRRTAVGRPGGFMIPNVKRTIHSSRDSANQRSAGRVDTCPAPQVVANLSGLWKGTLFGAGDDAETPFSLHQERERAEGAVVGQLAFTGSQAAPAN